MAIVLELAPDRDGYWPDPKSFELIARLRSVSERANNEWRMPAEDRVARYAAREYQEKRVCDFESAGSVPLAKAQEKFSRYQVLRQAHLEHMHLAIALLADEGVIVPYQPPADIADHPRPHNALPPVDRWAELGPFWVLPDNPGTWGRPHRSAADERAHQAALAAKAQRNQQLTVLARELLPPGTEITFTNVHTHTWDRESKQDPWTWVPCTPYTTQHAGTVRGEPQELHGEIVVSVEAPPTTPMHRGSSSYVAVVKLLPEDRRPE